MLDKGPRRIDLARRADGDEGVGRATSSAKDDGSSGSTDWNSSTSSAWSSEPTSNTWNSNSGSSSSSSNNNNWSSSSSSNNWSSSSSSSSQQWQPSSSSSSDDSNQWQSTSSSEDWNTWQQETSSSQQQNWDQSSSWSSSQDWSDSSSSDDWDQSSSSWVDLSSSTQTSSVPTTTAAPSTSTTLTSDTASTTSADGTLNSNDSASKDAASTGTKSSKLGSGAIAGIVIALLVGIALLAALLLWLKKKRKQNQEQQEMEQVYNDVDAMYPSNIGNFTTFRDDVSTHTSNMGSNANLADASGHFQPSMPPPPMPAYSAAFSLPTENRPLSPVGYNVAPVGQSHGVPPVIPPVITRSAEGPEDDDASHYEDEEEVYSRHSHGYYNRRSTQSNASRTGGNAHMKKESLASTVDDGDMARPSSLFYTDALRNNLSRIPEGDHEMVPPAVPAAYNVHQTPHNPYTYSRDNLVIQPAANGGYLDRSRSIGSVHSNFSLEDDYNYRNTAPLRIGTPNNDARR